MTVLDFLANLRDHDIRVWVEGERLRCSAPAGTLTPQLRHELRQRKPEIVKFLLSAETLAQQQRALVPLQRHGTGPPIFAVAGHNGDVFCYRALVRHLGDDQPFFGLQPPGLDGHSEPLARLEDLAAYFASQIRAFHPDRPCVIAGYCAGGTIAFELARQLRADGMSVPLLALFGSPFPTWYRLIPRWRRFLSVGVGQGIKHVSALISLPTAERRAYVAERLHNLKTQRAERTDNPDPVLVLRARVERATFTALRRYVPKRFDGPLRLFLPGKSWPLATEAAAQWRSVAAQTETVCGPDGCNGDTMLREPHAAAFAELLRPRLARRDAPPVESPVGQAA